MDSLEKSLFVHYDESGRRQAMFYCAQQFWKAFFPRINPAEITWALNQLPPDAHALFLKQSKAEQRHSLDVAKDLAVSDLRGAQDGLTPADRQNLISAALLHDCGKSAVTTRLWQRVFVVILQKFPPSVWASLVDSSTFLAAPLKTAGQHALWGSDLARESGLNQAVCTLIAEHHSPGSLLGRVLAEADRRN